MTNKTEDYNILILAMSTLPIREGKVMENQFTWEGEDKSYPYISQLEPITRMLVKRGHCPDEVLMICTADTIERKEKIIYASSREEVEKMSAVTFYTKRIQQMEQVENIAFIPFRVDQYDALDKKKTIAAIAEHVIEKKTAIYGEKNLKVWIDTQGGFRDVTFLTNAIFSLLKMAEVIPAGIYSINFQNGKIENYIMDQTETYRIFDFVSGMNEFVRYGRADQLEEYYKSLKEIPPVIKSMKKLADAIQFCNIGTFDKVLKDLQTDIENVNQTDPLFSVFINQIRIDYGKLLSPEVTKLDIMEWFFHKKFYQQALTYLEAKIPEEWNEKNILRFEVTQKNGEVVQDVVHKDIYWPKLLNSLLARTLDLDELKKTEIIEENNKYVYKRAGENLDGYMAILKEKIKRSSESTSYWERMKRLPTKNNPLYFSDSVTVKREDENFGKKKETIKVKVMSLATNATLLYKEVILFKILKDERNLFNHMGSGAKMQPEDLNWFIQYFIQIGRELYQNIEAQSSQN